MKHTGQFDLRATLLAMFSDGANLMLSEYGATIHRPLGLSILMVAVLHVVAEGSGKQMCRINTQRCVARVENLVPVRDVPAIKFIRQSVGLAGNSTVSKSISPATAVAETSITTERRSRPDPTTIGLADEFPEAINRIPAMREKAHPAAITCVVRSMGLHAANEKAITSSVGTD